MAWILKTLCHSAAAGNILKIISYNLLTIFQLADHFKRFWLKKQVSSENKFWVSFFFFTCKPRRVQLHLTLYKIPRITVRSAAVTDVKRLDIDLISSKVKHTTVIMGICSVTTSWLSHIHGLYLQHRVLCPSEVFVKTTLLSVTEQNPKMERTSFNGEFTLQAINVKGPQPAVVAQEVCDNIKYCF